MALTPGTRLGPYEILAPLGAGGMGEVYRARDTRLDREVAVKVLPAHLSQDADARARFEREAKAVAALSHPNILAIHDFGLEGGTAYAVTELLEGETLRHKMDGSALPARKAIEIALQVTHGLSAAHEKGIVHRDLKPENVFVTDDGRVKILDFGLAKLEPPVGPESGSHVPTRQAATHPGTVLGTPGYMSPEQVRGRTVDERTDLFAFGAILYEMLSGSRAFERDSAADTMSAILKEDPPELSQSGRSFPPGLDRIVHHCLEKNPQQRFQSARDIAFALESLSGTSGSTSQPAIRGGAGLPKRAMAALAALVVVAAGILAGWMAGVRGVAKDPPSWHRLTFRRGTIWSARFSPDGKTIVYGAAFEGKPVELFMTRPESPESKPLGFPKADILSISSAGELAVMLDARTGTRNYVRSGTLARMPLVGGSPRPILDDVRFADWSPDGKDLAVMREVGGRMRLEYPIGTLVRESHQVYPRVSPDGALVAYFGFSSGPNVSVSVVDKAGKVKVLTDGWKDWWNLCWSPDGAEVWFAAPEPGASRETSALYAVSLSGKVRLLARVPGTLELHDTSKDGRALVGRLNYRGVVRGMLTGESREQDLSWLGSSNASDLSSDGTTLLFDEDGEGSGPGSSIYIRKSDGSAPTLIGEGTSFTLSPDGKWVLSGQVTQTGQRLVLLPTGSGNPVEVNTEGLSGFSFGNWFPDGRRLLLDAVEPGRTRRLYVVPIEGGPPKPISPEGFSLKEFGNSISPDGRLVAAIDPSERAWIFPTESGEGKPIAGMEPGEVPLQWSADGRSLYLVRGGEVPGKVWRLDLATAKRSFVMELIPADPAGVTSLESILLTPDGRSYAYSYHNNLSDLYLVDGLK